MSQLLRIGIILLFCQSVFSQSHYYKQYTVADGMPQTEITKVFIDNQGYIWASCANSWITRFDGLEFTNFSPDEIGMVHHSYQFMETDDGIFAWDLRENMSRFHQGKWTTVEMPDSLTAVMQFSKWGILGLDNSGKLFRLLPETLKWAFVNQLQIPSLKREELLSVNFFSLAEKIFVYLRFKEQQPQFWEVDHPESGLALLINNDNSIKFIGEDFIYSQNQKGDIIFEKENGVKKTVLKNPESFQLLGNEPEIGLWIQAKLPEKNQKGLYCLDDNGEIIHGLLIDRPITSIAIDTLGVYWMSSQGGLIQLNPWEQLFFENQPGMIPNLHCIAEDSTGKIWLGGYRDGLVTFDGKKLNQFVTSGNELRLLPGSYCSPDGELYLWTENYGLVFINDTGCHTVPLYNSESNQTLTGYYFLSLSSGKLGLGTTKKGLGLLSPPFKNGENCRFIGREKGLLLDNVLCMEEDLTGRIWCGRTSQGIALYDIQNDTAITWLINDYPDPGIGALSMEIDWKGNLWLGTNKGLYFLKDPQNFNIHSDSLFKQLTPVVIPEAGQSTVFALLAHQQWLVFSNGIGHGFIDLKNFYKDPENPRVLFTNTVEPERGGAGEQNAILVDRNQRIWIGKDRGAVCIDFNLLPMAPLELKMAEPILFAGGSSLELSNSAITLPLSKRSLKVILHPEFKGNTDRNVQFKYRLSGNNIQSNIFTELNRKPEIFFDYLPPGKYQIELQMFRHNQLADSRLLKIEVPGTLSEKPLFWFCIAGTLFLLIGVGFYFRRRAELLRKKAELDNVNWNNKFQQTQIQAITSSLNPHFINNSLNWLQYKVIEDKQAVAVVGRLSENIRLIFQHSRAGKPDHSLEEELRLVENYLYIQNARYDEKIDASLPNLTDNPALGNIHVPIMQLLIHVENAIEHGLRNSKEAKALDVTAKAENDYLVFTVTDDGIGRPKAKLMKSHGTQEGTKMLNELHQILNGKNKLKISTWYEDTPFTNQHTGEKYGTKVHIQIPLTFDYGNNKS